MRAAIRQVLFGRSRFNPLSLFANGAQGFIFLPSDTTTLYQDDAGTTPVTDAGQPVGLILDKSGNGNNASQTTPTARPTYQIFSSRLAVDKVDDRLQVTVPAGGLVGTLVLATPEGTAAYGVNIPAGTWSLGANSTTGTAYFPGSAVIGAVCRNGALTESEQSQVMAYLRSRGGGPIGYAGMTSLSGYWQNAAWLKTPPSLPDTSLVTDFSYAWMDSGITSFPALPDTSNAVNFSYAWLRCTGLTSFPALPNTSEVTSFSYAWYGCSGLTSFPALPNTTKVQQFVLSWHDCSGLTSFPALPDTSSVTNFSHAWNDCTNLANFPANVFDNCPCADFPNTFRNCALSQASVDNILVSIAAGSVARGTTNGILNINGGTSATPSATGQAAADTLRARGWTVTLNGY